MHAAVDATLTTLFRKLRPRRKWKGDIAGRLVEFIPGRQGSYHGHDGGTRRLYEIIGTSPGGHGARKCRTHTCRTGWILGMWHDWIVGFPILASNVGVSPDFVTRVRVKVTVLEQFVYHS